MATKFRTHVPILAAIAGLFVTPICYSAEERTPSADDAVHVTAKKDGQTITVDAVFNVAATQRQAWDVLTDFDHMPNFVPNLESSKVVSRSGNVLQVAQKGRETYGLLSFSFDNLREVELAPYTKIKSHLISGSMQKSDGTTHLSENGSMTQVTYHGVFIPNVNVPGLLGIPAIESATRRQFDELRREMGRRAK
jgi:carbon monoxide dehydrogenase subunit G